MSETHHEAHHETHHETHPKGKGVWLYVSQLEDFLELYLVKKAPALPKNWKEIIVKIAPWLIIVGTVLSVFGLFGLFSMMSYLSSANPYAAAAMQQVTLGPMFYLSMAILIAVIVLEAMAVPALFARKKKGWNFIFYSTLLSIVSSLISINAGSILLSALSIILSLYILFQVREYYK